MTITRSALEAVFEELITNQRAVDFQRIAVPLARERCPGLVASEISKDGGEDAYLIGRLPDGELLSVTCSITATLKKIRLDLAKIKRRKPEVKTAWFYTADTPTTQKIDRWKPAVKGDFDIQLEVITREDIVGRLLDPRYHYLAHHHLGFPHPQGDAVSRTREVLAQGAPARLEQWLSLRVDRRVQPVARDFAMDDGENAATQGLSVVEVAGRFIGGGLFVIWGEAGVGKSVALGQLAQAYCESLTRPLALLISAPAWAHSGQELPVFLSHQFIGGNESFSASVMSLLRAGEIGVFVNGWNEVAPEERAGLTEHLRNLLHAAPGCPVVLTSRTLAGLAALAPAGYFRVQPLSDEFRRQMARQLAPDTLEILQTVFARDSGVNALSRLPLFLIPLVDATQRGERLPASRHALLETVLRAMERSPDHASTWSDPAVTADVRPALGHIAVELSIRGTTETTRAEVERWLNTVPLNAASHPVAAFLERLIQHHVLDRDSADTIRFQHEYFQDWLCAQYLRSQALRPSLSDATLAQWLDNRRLCAALDLMVAALADDPNEGAARALSERVFRLSIEVDLQLAARWLPTLEHRVSPIGLEEWKSRIREQLALEGPARQLALAAVFDARVPDFAEDIWQQLESAAEQPPREVYHFRHLIPVEVLGPNWRSRLLQWSPTRRADFLTNRAYVARSEDPLALQRDFALRDPSALVRAECIREVSAKDPVAAENLFATASEACREELLDFADWGDFPPGCIASYLPVLEELATYPVTTPRARQALIYLARRYPEKAVATYRQELEHAILNSLDYDRILRFLTQHDRHWTGKWLLQQLAQGKHVLQSSVELLDDLHDSAAVLEVVDRVLASPTEPDRARARSLSLLVRLNHGELLERCFAEWVRARRSLAEAGEPTPRPLWERLGEIEAALKQAAVGPLLVAAEAYRAELESAAAVEALAGVLTGALAEAQGRDEEPVDPTAALRIVVDRLASVALASTDPSGRCKEAVARLIGQTGDAALREPLERLLAAERVRALASRSSPALSPPGQARIYYSRETTYATAVRKVAGTQSIDALLPLLEMEPFELAAAGQLMEVLAVRAGRPEPPIPSQIDWRAIAKLHQGTLAPPVTTDERKIAVAFARRIALWKGTMSDPSGLMHRQALVELEILHAQIVRTVDVHILMSYPINQYSIYAVAGWAEALVRAGVLSPSVWMERALALLLSSTEPPWLKEDDKGRLVNQCLIALMFSDHPGLASQRIRALPSNGYPQWRLADLLVPIAVSGIPDQVGLLLALMPDTTGDPWWKWARALEHLPPATQRQLVSALLSAHTPGPLTEVLASCVHPEVGPTIASIIEASSSLRATIEALAADPQAQQRPFAISILTHIDDLRAADQLLSIAISDPAQRASAADTLLAVRWDRKAGGKYKAGGRSPSGWAARAITPLRQRLLALTVNEDESLRQWATHVLLDIDETTDGEFPLDEPRHPDLASGLGWPVPAAIGVVK